MEIHQGGGRTAITGRTSVPACHCFYHGKVKGVIVPAEERSKTKASKHPFFGMAFGEKKAVEQVME